MPSWFSVPVSKLHGGAVSAVASFSGSQARADVAAGVQEPDVRAEELVGRAEQEVAVDGAHVDGPVQRVVHGVDDATGAPSGVRQVGGAAHVVDGADGVGRVADARPPSSSPG